MIQKHMKDKEQTDLVQHNIQSLKEEYNENINNLNDKAK